MVSSTVTERKLFLNYDPFIAVEILNMEQAFFRRREQEQKTKVKIINKQEREAEKLPSASMKCLKLFYL